MTFIFSGTPTLATNAGEIVLQLGMCIGFRAGEADGTIWWEDVVYLEIGDRSPGNSGSYPDDDLQAVMGSDDKWQFLYKDGSAY